MSATDDLAFVRFIVNEQEKQQIILSLSELMVMRYLSDNKKIGLGEIKRIAQITDDEAKKCCMELVKYGLIETVGKKYMLTARVYEAVKSDVEYSRDKVIQYIKAKEMIMTYFDKNNDITNVKVQELCGFSKQQARSVLDKMRSEKLIELYGQGRSSKYKLIE